MMFTRRALSHFLMCALLLGFATCQATTYRCLVGFDSTDKHLTVFFKDYIQKDSLFKDFEFDIIPPLYGYSGLKTIENAGDDYDLFFYFHLSATSRIYLSDENRFRALSQKAQHRMVIVVRPGVDIVDTVTNPDDVTPQNGEGYGLEDGYDFVVHFAFNNMKKVVSENNTTSWNALTKYMTLTIKQIKAGEKRERTPVKEQPKTQPEVLVEEQPAPEVLVKEQPKKELGWYAKMKMQESLKQKEKELADFKARKKALKQEIADLEKQLKPKRSNLGIKYRS